MVCWMTAPFPSHRRMKYTDSVPARLMAADAVRICNHMTSASSLWTHQCPLLGIERKYGHENTFQNGEFEADLSIQDTSTPGIKPASILSSNSRSTPIILNYLTSRFTWSTQTKSFNRHHAFYRQCFRRVRDRGTCLARGRTQPSA